MQKTINTKEKASRLKSAFYYACLFFFLIGCGQIQKNPLEKIQDSINKKDVKFDETVSFIRVVSRGQPVYLIKKDGEWINTNICVYTFPYLAFGMEIPCFTSIKETSSEKVFQKNSKKVVEIMIANGLDELTVDHNSVSYYRQRSFF